MPGPALALQPAPRCGVYGKLPAAGDFVRRGLSAAAARGLQDWLQAGLARVSGGDPMNRDALISHAPTWAFAASAGVVEDVAVTGLMAPSQDRVGRIFPLMVFAESDGLAIPSACAAWLKSLADVMKLADQGRDADNLLEAVAQLGSPPVAGTAARQEDVGASLWWRPDAARPKAMRFEGLPMDAAFEKLFESRRKPPRSSKSRRGVPVRGET